MAIARTPRSGGIEDWANQGFEYKVVQEVKKALAEADAKHAMQMKELQGDMRQMKKYVDHINGFYTWLMEVYPETYVQHKSLMDLQKASEENPNRLRRDANI